jgi:glycosyltransferase involved in cell wall biosynthesis
MEWTSERTFEVHSLAELSKSSVSSALDQLGPNVIFVNGWSDRGALLGLSWGLKNAVPAVLMSDSQIDDEPRTFWKEQFKRLIVRACDAAFVAGERHTRYVKALGMDEGNIVTGYDVVDNDHFRIGADEPRSDRETWVRRLGLPSDNFFLCIARFQRKKNLSGLLHAFATYHKSALARNAVSPPWHLVIAGDGPLRTAIEHEIASLSLTETVHLLEFQQYDTLPACYGLAGAFVLASTTDQWGLVVNEAMAAGLPVIVSRRCGCVPELVHEGINGFQFDPSKGRDLAELLLRVSTADEPIRKAWGEASRRIIERWSLKRFAAAMAEVAQIASQARGRTPRSRFFAAAILDLAARFRP